MAVLLGACSDSSFQPTGGGTATDFEVSQTTITTDPPPPNQPRGATVTFVQDGDSAIVDLDGSEERIRLIGVNTPERDECFGNESRELLRALVEGKEVLVATDIEATDRFGRILAYVYLDKTLINAEMVRRGAAIARPFEPNTTLQDTLEDAEQQARSDQVGMWSTTECGGDAVPTVAVIQVFENAPGRDDENPNGEWVVVENQSQATVDLSGWGIKDESSVHRYTFPDGTTVEPGGQLIVYSGCGSNDPPELFWCGGSPVWDNSGDTAFLTDPTGQVRHLLSY